MWYLEREVTFHKSIVRFGTLANPITSFWRFCRGLVFNHKAIWVFISLLDLVICFFFLLCSWVVYVYDFHSFNLCLMFVSGYALKHDLVVGRS